MYYVVYYHCRGCSKQLERRENSVTFEMYCFECNKEVNREHKTKSRITKDLEKSQNEKKNKRIII